MEYHPAIKESQLLIHTTTWVNLTDIILSKEKARVSTV